MPLPSSHPHDPAQERTRSKVALDLYLRHLASPPPSECAAALQDLPIGFLYWPEAAEQALILQPQGLPHALLPCARPAAIPVEDLTALGPLPPALQALVTDLNRPKDGQGPARPVAPDQEGK